MKKVVKEKKWFKPMFDFDDGDSQKTNKQETVNEVKKASTFKESPPKIVNPNQFKNVGSKNWLKNFDPDDVEDLAVNTKKVQEVETWLKCSTDKNSSDILLLTGPVGCGKTITVKMLAKKHNTKVTEWITPIDIDIPTDHGDYEYREKQSTKFQDFILNAANFTSLLDNNQKKVVLVEDLPNTFLKTPSEFTEVLRQYSLRAKSPIVFICSESHTDNKNTSGNLFTQSLKEQFQVHHVSLNGISTTGLKSALKRVSELISKRYTAVYNTPSSDLIDCVVNTSAGDVRSAILNLHFACLKGSNQNLETSLIREKESKSKGSRKKKASSKFMSIGKDQTVSILHGVGRVLNPKVVESENGAKRMTHSPHQIIEQFLSQPSSFVNFLEENYLPHFSCTHDVNKAASALSDADYMLAEWREKMCQEYGLYVSVAGLMVANKSPVSAWNPVRGPKNMKITYPSPSEFPMLEQNYLYKGKVLVADYQTYCKIIGTTHPSNG